MVRQHVGISGVNTPYSTASIRVSQMALTAVLFSRLLLPLLKFAVGGFISPLFGFAGSLLGWRGDEERDAYRRRRGGGRGWFSRDWWDSVPAGGGGGTGGGSFGVGTPVCDPLSGIPVATPLGYDTGAGGSGGDGAPVS
jgi:hypothetical protein